MLTLAFHCLRRGADGSRLEDQAVELRLSGVAAIAVAYDPFWLEERPSGVQVTSELLIGGLDPWPLAGAAIADPAYSIAEPVVDLDSHDAPEDLLRPVVAWFEAQHAGDAEYTDMVYARSISDWWIEGRRASASVVGVEHYPPSDGEPADSRVAKWSFALRLRGGGWTVRDWALCSTDGPLPPWTSRWRAGPLRIR